jgi:hypothetical protein
MSEELEELVIKELTFLAGGLLMIEGIVEEDATKDERETEKGLVAREGEALDYEMSGDATESRISRRRRQMGRTRLFSADHRQRYSLRVAEGSR